MAAAIPAALIGEVERRRVMNCQICLEKDPLAPKPANAQCTDCGQFACFDHMVRVKLGSFLCLSCYEEKETVYRSQRRLVEKPRYRVPRKPGTP